MAGVRAFARAGRPKGEKPDHKWCDVEHITSVRAFASADTRHAPKFLLRMLNSMRGRWESFWAPGRGGRARVVRIHDAAHGMAYTITNPVAAGLVANPTAWPGLISTPADVEAAATGERSWTFKRPTFFRTKKQQGIIDATATLKLTPHPLAKGDEVGFAKDVSNRVREMVGKKVAEVRAAGGRFAGAAAVRRTNPNGRPKTSEARRTINPRWACQDTELRKQLLKMTKVEEAHYRDAHKDWLAGEPAVFPFGTNQLRGYPGVIGAREGLLAV